jgi:hypothetical protein
MRYHVTVFKAGAKRDRYGFSSGKSHEDARDRFIRSRRTSSLNQLKDPIAAVSVGVCENGPLENVRLYGAEIEGYPLMTSIRDFQHLMGVIGLNDA